MNDGGPAYPTQYSNEADGPTIMPSTGMTLRDYIATKVCAALMTSTSADNDFPNLDYQRTEGGPTAGERMADISVKLADLLIERLQRQRS